ncbi:MAG: four helix bundle protein [Patescibacteria group bacterium]
MEILELIYIASYLPKKDKLPYISKAITKLDVLKFFLQTLWEVKAIDSKKYSLIFEPINKAGAMLGGWRNQLLKQTPQQSIGEK